MTLSFLCIRHRQLLSADPAYALSTWQRSYESGLLLEQQDKDYLALRHAGCAMETAALILNILPSPGRPDVVRYCHSVLLVARLLKRREVHEVAMKIIDEASTALAQLRLPDAEADMIEQARARLRSLESADSPSAADQALTH